MEEGDPRRGRDAVGERILMPVMANEPIILNVYDMVRVESDRKPLCNRMTDSFKLY